MEASQYLPMFLAEGREHLQTLNVSLVRVERDPTDAASIEDIFRVAHTLKAMSGTMGFGSMESLTHEMESVMEGMREEGGELAPAAVETLFGCLDALERLVSEIEMHGSEQSDPVELVSRLRALGPDELEPPERQAPRTVRVRVERLDELLDVLGEMAGARARVEALAPIAADPELAAAIDDLAFLERSLAGIATELRLAPLEQAFMRFPRLVRDLATTLGKQVDLRITGGDIELDRALVDALAAPLVHLVRNAIAHGLETPLERVAAGKVPVGTLTLSAERDGEQVSIGVGDDGRGVDPVAVGRIAAHRGLIDRERAAALTLEEAIELLFTPGFSTAGATSAIAGRGIGMDAVRTMVGDLGGDCLLTSTPGRGTAVTIRLPLRAEESRPRAGFSDIELSAIREIASIGSGNAATALSQLVARMVEIGMPQAELVPLAEAASRIGPAEGEVVAVLTPVTGGLDASLLLAFPIAAAEALCGLLGTDAASDMGRSALEEIGNILSSCYATAIAGLTGLAIDPAPARLRRDRLDAVVAAVLAPAASPTGTVLLLQTSMRVEGAAVEFGFLLVPGEGMVPKLLRALDLDQAGSA